LTTWALAAASLLMAPARVRAEWQFKPFAGLTFGGGTTLVDYDNAAGTTKLAFGVSGLLLGEIFGVEGDFGRTPGFFESGRASESLVRSSAATTLTGNAVVAAPRHATRYSLRPYVVAGGGLMRARSFDKLGNPILAKTLPAVDVGGGATGFLTERVGLSWDLRYFRGIGGVPTGQSVGRESLSFWRASMALAIRY